MIESCLPPACCRRFWKGHAIQYREFLAFAVCRRHEDRPPTC